MFRSELSDCVCCARFQASPGPQYSSLQPLTSLRLSILILCLSPLLHFTLEDHRSQRLDVDFGRLDVHALEALCCCSKTMVMSLIRGRAPWRPIENTSDMDFTG